MTPDARSAVVFAVRAGLYGRLRRNVVRLRQPRYLLGALAGGAYLLFVLTVMLGPEPDGQAMDPALARTFGALVGAALLWVLLAVQCVSGRRGLAFVDNELRFLQPTPLPRDGYLLFLALRQQPQLLVIGALLGLAAGRAQQLEGWLSVIGGPLLFNLFFAFSTLWSLTLGDWTDRGRPAWQLRALGPLALLALLGCVGAAMLAGPLDWDKGEALALEVAARAPLADALVVPKLLAWAVLPPDPLRWLAGAASCLALTALCWRAAVRTRCDFLPASLAFATRQAEVRAAIEEGKALAPRNRVAGYEPFALGPRGPLWVALLWRNLIAVGPLARPGNLLYGLAVAVAGGLLAAQQIPPVAQLTVALLAVYGGMLIVIMASARMRVGLSQDFGRLAWFRAAPIAGGELMIGSAVASAAVMGGLILIPLGFAISVLAVGPQGTPLPIAPRVACGLAGAGLAFAAPLLYSVVKDSLALAFPGWFRVREQERGLARIGQTAVQVMVGMAAMLAVCLPATVAAGVAGAVTLTLTRGLGLARELALAATILASGLSLAGVLAMTAVGLALGVGSWLWPQVAPDDAT